jgi:hypothetical protein
MEVTTYSPVTLLKKERDKGRSVVEATVPACAGCANMGGDNQRDCQRQQCKSRFAIHSGFFPKARCLSFSKLRVNRLQPRSVRRP